MADIQVGGMYFEEFSEGLQFDSPARTVTEADVVMFAALSGDYNPLHTDAEFAKGTPFGQRIAHGLLGLSIASGLAARCGFIDGTAQAFLGLSWRFKAPILFGDTVRIRATVGNTRAMARMGGGLVVFKIDVINQDDVVVQEGEWRLLVKGRDSG